MGVLFEMVGPGVPAIAGTIGVLLWTDRRCGLDARAVRTLAGLVLGTAAGAVVALRLVALATPLASIAAVAACLAGWCLVVLLTTRPARGRR